MKSFSGTFHAFLSTSIQFSIFPFIPFFNPKTTTPRRFGARCIGRRTALLRCNSNSSWVPGEINPFSFRSHFTVKFSETEWFTPFELPVIVTVPEGVPEFPPPPPLLPPPPQLAIHTRLTIRSAKTGTRRRLELLTATIEPARSNANAKRIRKFSIGCEGVLHVVGFESGPNAELAVVVTVAVKAVAVVPFAVTEVGETTHVDFASASVQPSVTVPLKPLTGET